MSTPSAKRRRLDGAAKTLHKPFKSPFHVEAQLTESLHDTTSDSLSVSTPTNSRTSKDIHPHSELSPTQTTQTPTIFKPLSRLPQSSLKKSTGTPSLNRTILSLRSDIQTLTQAYNLATSTKDVDLETIVSRWRQAARAAAEEVYSGTRDRVNRMGGVGAWKQREREQMEWRNRWDREGMEEGRGESGDGDDNADPPADEEQQEEGRDGGPDDETFAMDMMLKTLNIDLALIGYDREAQRWAD